MNKKLKTILYIIIGLAVFTGGFLLIRAAYNRGDQPYIYFKFDEGYGTSTYDEMGNLNATITGATWASEDECVAGKCLYYDGSGDYVSIPDFDLE